MKVKLLKKVRRRFSIVHCPKGVYIGTEYAAGNIYALYDKEDCFVYRTRYSYLKGYPNPKGTGEFDNEKGCINYLKEKIIDRLRDEYPSNAARQRTIKAQKKVWHI